MAGQHQREARQASSPSTPTWRRSPCWPGASCSTALRQAQAFSRSVVRLLWLGLLVLFETKDCAGQAFNVTGRVQARVTELAALVAAVVPGADIRFTPGQATNDYDHALFSLTALKRRGRTPTLPRLDGLVRYAGWL